MRSLPGRLLRVAAGIGLAMPMLGCTPARLLNALVTEQGYKVERGIAYGAAPRQKLDIYRPEATPSKNAPVAVFFYGGRWQYGSRADYLFVGQALASRGIMTIIPDYRLHPEVRFPDFVEDGAKALAWVKRNIADHGGKPERIHLIGHSAGAHIAAMLALDGSFLAAETMRLQDLGAMVGLAGPYDFLPIKDPIVKEIFAVDDLSRTQPISHVREVRPPFLLLAGGDDDVVLPGNSERLGAAIQESGGTATVTIYPRLGHVGLILALAAPFRWLAPVLDDSVRFIQSTEDRSR